LKDELVVRAHSVDVTLNTLEGAATHFDEIAFREVVVRGENGIARLGEPHILELPLEPFLIDDVDELSDPPVPVGAVGLVEAAEEKKVSREEGDTNVDLTTTVVGRAAG